MIIGGSIPRLLFSSEHYIEVKKMFYLIKRNAWYIIGGQYHADTSYHQQMEPVAALLQSHDYYSDFS